MRIVFLHQFDTCYVIILFLGYVYKHKVLQLNTHTHPLFQIKLKGYGLQHRSFFTYKGDFLLNIAVLKIVALDGLVRPVQLPGDPKVGEDDGQAGEECAENRQSHDEGGVV